MKPINTKPATPKRPRRAAALQAVPAAALTADQLRAAQYFGAMDDGAQEAMLRMLAAMAESCPRRARPALHLVSGGAK